MNEPKPYRVATADEMKALGYGSVEERLGKVLLGIDGFECLLGEPEDCTWNRDGTSVVTELNRLYAIARRYEELVDDLCQKMMVKGGDE